MLPGSLVPLAVNGELGQPRLVTLKLRSHLPAGLVFVASALCVVGLYWGSSALLNQYDDAYITYRYAVQLARGNGLSYNLGERIDSASSLSYTLLLALFYWLGWTNLELVATCIGIGSAAGLAAVIFVAIRHLTNNARLGIAFAVFTAANGLISGWAISGMESVLYAFLVVLAVYWGILLGETGWRVAAVLALAVLTRHEAIILVGCWALPALIALGRTSTEGRRRMVTTTLVVGTVGLSLLAFKFAYYGSVLPDAFRFKQVWSAYQPRPAELFDTWQATSGIAVVAAVGGLGVLKTWRARLALCAYLGLSAFALATGPRSGWARYSIHLLPIVMILAATCVATLLERQRTLAWVFVVLIAWQTSTSANAVKDFMEKLSIHQKCRKEIGRGLQRDWKGSTVLSSDIGAIAYEARDVQFVDAVGLTSPDVLRVFLAGGSLSPVFEAKRPDLVADTWYPEGRGPKGSFQALKVLSSPEGYTTTHVSPPAFLQEIQVGQRIYECRSPDGYLFAAAPLLPRSSVDTSK